MSKERRGRILLSAILCVILSVVIVLSLASCEEKPPEVTPMPNEGLAPVESFKEITKGDTIYLVPTDEKISIVKNNRKLQPEELIMVTSLQGAVARDKAQIYIGKEGDEWSTYLTENYGVNFEVITSLEDLFSKVEGSLQSKSYVKFSYDDTAIYTSRINQATTICSALGCIMAPVGSDEKLVEFLDGRGFTVAEDLTGSSETESGVINKYADKLSKDVIAMLDPLMKSQYELRDYVIATGAGVIMTDYTKKDILSGIYETYNPLAISIGASWRTSNFDGASNILGMYMDQWAEISSTAGIIPVYSESTPNLSLFASLSKDVGTQKATKDNSASGDVHYVSVLFNISNDIGFWNDAFSSSKKFADDSKGQYPMGYTMSAALVELMPNAVKRAYAEMTDNDFFVAGPSGFGYADFDALKGHNDGATLTKYLERSNELFGKADLGYVSYMGSIADTENISQISALSNVKGGFVLTPDFVTPTGGILFSNDKAFIASREVLRGDSYRTNEQIASDSTAKMATRLSTYSKDKTSAEGYTLIQVESSASDNTIAKLVSKLYEGAGDDVCFVTPNQLLDLINQNVNKEGELTQTVGSLNKAPVASDISVETTEGTKITIDVSEYVTDENVEDEDSLTVKLALRPEHGKFSISKMKINYTPESGFTGTETFEYTVSDGNELVKATITVTVK